MSSSCSLGSILSTTRCVRLAFCCSHAHSSSSSSAALAAAGRRSFSSASGAPSHLHGVKAAALVRSIVEAWVAPCALLLLRLAEATGAVRCCESRCRQSAWTAAPARSLPQSSRTVAGKEGVVAGVAQSVFNISVTQGLCCNALRSCDHSRSNSPLPAQQHEVTASPR